MLFTPDNKTPPRKPSVSVVTPTLRRATEIAGLLHNLSEQTLLPEEIVLVDGAPASEVETQNLVSKISRTLPFRCRYVRHERGTAIQRNRGIEEASLGDFIAFIDDDVRLEPDFMRTIMEVFEEDSEKKVGGVVGYRANVSFIQNSHRRWRWYQRLKLLSTYEPGRYDFNCGYPINANSQPPFSGVRGVDFMTTACAVWRREVFEDGLRFDPFFSDYGVLEDAHFSLRAGRKWQLLQSGDAVCHEGHSPNGRVDRKKIGYKCVVNYYYVFQDIVQPLTWRHHLRFWRFQLFELLRLAASAVGRRRSSDLLEVRGRLAGFAGVLRGHGSPRINNAI
jgi:GT2 family glycosyltransferase